MLEWKEIISGCAAIMRKQGAALLIALFLVLEGAAALPASMGTGQDDMLIRRGPAAQEAVVATKRIPKLSEMRGPRIDDEAAAIVLDDAVVADVAPACETLPADICVMLFFAYLALMVFNLSYRFVFPADQHRIQWFWEAAYTLAFIGMWYAWDGCRSAEWYPIAIAKMAVFLYAAYLYFFDRRMRK